METQYPDIWRFDVNRRVYQDSEGNRFSSPIYREHWVKVIIEGETSKSWIPSRGEKIPKKPSTEGHKIYAYSLEEVENDVWMHHNVYRLSEKLRTVTDVEVLKQIAEMIGYKA